MERGGAGMSVRRAKDSVTLLPCFYFVELPILASSVVSLYFLELTDIFKPVVSGYSCNDRSLSLPYVEPTHEVVPFPMLLSLAFAGPTVTIMVGEGILYCCLTRRKAGAGTESDINAAGCNFNSFIRRAVRFVGVHVFGLCATALITDIIQLTTGYHAPYFLTVCKPNYTTLNTSCEENSYIIEDICSGGDLALINSGRKSFPSQHATLAAFAAVYISMYFNATINDSSKLLKPLLVFSFIICALICGLTRIIQHKNHAIDVYLGFLIGGGIAVYLGLYAVGNFQPNQESLCQAPQTRKSPIDFRHEVSRRSQNKGSSSMDGISLRSGRFHNRSQRDASLKRASADVDVLTSRGPMAKENMVTFNTLPRVQTQSQSQSQSQVPEGIMSRRHNVIHASMDSARSKQLLSQWRSKNENRRLSLHVIENELGHSPDRVEVRIGEHQGLPSQLLKLPSNPLPNNSSGIAGGTRVSLPPRPSSAKLVHIPEEIQEAVNASPKGGSTRAKWLRLAEKSNTCKPGNQPRIMQVIALSKQQGLLQNNPEGGVISCTGAIRYQALTEQEPVSIVRVEAHPESGRPTVQLPDPSEAAWKWKAQERASFRKSYELNHLGREPEERSSPDVNQQHPQQHPQQQPPINTIRVTPVESSEGASSTSSQESTLRKKGSIILVPERGNSPENTRNIFYKGTSQSQAFSQ